MGGVGIRTMHRNDFAVSSLRRGWNGLQDCREVRRSGRARAPPFVFDVDVDIYLGAIGTAIAKQAYIYTIVHELSGRSLHDLTCGTKGNTTTARGESRPGHELALENDEPARAQA